MSKKLYRVSQLRELGGSFLRVIECRNKKTVICLMYINWQAFFTVPVRTGCFTRPKLFHLGERSAYHRITIGNNQPTVVGLSRDSSLWNTLCGHQATTAICYERYNSFCNSLNLKPIHCFPPDVVSKHYDSLVYMLFYIGILDAYLEFRWHSTLHLYVLYIS